MRRGEIWLTRFDPTVGSEIRKIRPALAITPDEIRHLRTAICVPLTTGSHPLPTRVRVHFDGRDGLIVLDQIRTMHRDPLIRKMGVIDRPTLLKVLETLQAMFAL